MTEANAGISESWQLFTQWWWGPVIYFILGALGIAGVLVGSTLEEVSVGHA